MLHLMASARRMTNRTGTRSAWAGLLLLTIAVLAACQPAPPTATPDIQATVRAAVAATRTAVPVATAAVQAPTPTPLPTSTPPLPVASLLLLPTPSPTAIPTTASTLTPTATATSTPRPTPTPTRGERRLTALLPWFADPPDEDHAKAAELLTFIWNQDANLGRAIVHLPWVSDGVQGDDLAALWYARRISEAKPGSVGLYRWPGPEKDTRGFVIQFLYHAAYSLRDDRDPAYEKFHPVPRGDLLLDLPQSVSDLLADRLTASDLLSLAYYDIDTATAVATDVSHLSGNYLLYALDGISRIGTDGRDGRQHLAKLRGTPWYADGLSEEESALIAALPSPRTHLEAFESLLQKGRLEER